MYKITKVSIKGFWGRYNISTKFFKDVNIFIGKNGTGKTTLINLLQGVLTVDLELLYNLQFEEITLILSQKQKTRKVVVSKIPNEFEIEYKALKYQIGTNVYNVPYVPKEIINILVGNQGGILTSSSGILSKLKTRSKSWLTYHIYLLTEIAFCHQMILVNPERIKLMQ